MSTSTSASRGRRKTKTKIHSYDPIRAVRITEKTTGLLLFEKVYKWNDNVAISNLGSLIQSFFQFAREVDGGGNRESNIDQLKM